MKTAIVLVLLLSGCATLPAGVQMTDDERAACAAQGCAVFTEQELRGLAQEVYKRGYSAGVKSL